MAQTMRFCDVVEAADLLSQEEQEALVAILQRRLAHAGRERVIADIRESEAELAAGGCKPATVEEIMREIRS